MTEREKTKARYAIATLFILCGFLIISIGGIGNNFIYKHYKGQIENFETEKAIVGSSTSILCAEYPYNIGNIGSTLYYDFYRYDIRPLKGLSFVIDGMWFWFSVIAGLAYVGFGACAIKKKDLLFR